MGHYFMAIIKSIVLLILFVLMSTVNRNFHSAQPQDLNKVNFRLKIVIRRLIVINYFEEMQHQ